MRIRRRLFVGRTLTTLAFVALVTAGRLAALSAPQTAPVPGVAPQEAPRISVDDLKALLKKGDALIVDVRATEGFALGHAEGAISIPLGELPGRMKELPRTKAIVAYCT